MPLVCMEEGCSWQCVGWHSTARYHAETFHKGPLNVFTPVPDEMAREHKRALWRVNKANQRKAVGKERGQLVSGLLVDA